MNDYTQEAAKLGVKMHNCGVSVFPKADGRVEIPQFVVHAMGWERINKVYITIEDIGVCVYTNNEGLNTAGFTLVSGGRIRIPASILKKTIFFKKPLMFVIERNRVIARKRAELSEVEECLKNIFGDEEKCINTLACKSSTKKKLIGKPELILLSMNHITIFRSVGFPFKFMASFNNTTREIVFSRPRHNIFAFYLIPGIKRVNDNDFIIGFLLLNSRTHEQLCRKIKENGIDREIMFYPGQTEIGGFRVFTNAPNTKYSAELISRAEHMCGDPKNLLETHFRQVVQNRNNDVYSTPPSIIASQTINLMCPEEK